MTPARFAKGMTFDDYLKFIGTPENLGREGFDIRRFSLAKPRVDWSGYLRERYAKARLSDEQAAAIKWLAAQPGWPAKVLVIAEDWSSDCRRDLPYLARLAEAGGLELRLFLRDAETMHRQGLPEPGSHPNADLVREYANEKNGQKFATVPVAVFFTRDFADRKSTRLNSSHVAISYAVFCLKKKKRLREMPGRRDKAHSSLAFS